MVEHPSQIHCTSLLAAVRHSAISMIPRVGDDDKEDEGFEALPPPPTENLDFHGGSSGQVSTSSAIDVFGGGDLLFASPELIFAPLTVTPLESNSGNRNGATGDPLMDLFGSPVAQPPEISVSQQQPEAEKVTTGGDLMESIMASVNQKKAATKEFCTSLSSGTAERPTRMSKEAKEFLKRIPDLGFVLSSKLQLPGLASAPQALNIAKRDNIGAAFETLEKEKEGIF